MYQIIFINTHHGASRRPEVWRGQLQQRLPGKREFLRRTVLAEIGPHTAAVKYEESQLGTDCCAAQQSNEMFVEMSDEMQELCWLGLARGLQEVCWQDRQVTPAHT